MHGTRLQEGDYTISEWSSSKIGTALPPYNLQGLLSHLDSMHTLYTLAAPRAYAIILCASKMLEVRNRIKE
jgi:hypothetical protein